MGELSLAMERTAHFSTVRRKAPAHYGGGAIPLSYALACGLPASQKSRASDFCACAASSEAMQTELARLLMTLEMWLLAANGVRRSCTRADKQENRKGTRDSRGLFCL